MKKQAVFNKVFHSGLALVQIFVLAFAMLPY